MIAPWKLLLRRSKPDPWLPTVGTIAFTEKREVSDRDGTRIVEDVTYEFAFDGWNCWGVSSFDNIGSTKNGDTVLVHYNPEELPPSSYISSLSVNEEHEIADLEATPKKIRQIGQKSVGKVIHIFAKRFQGVMVYGITFGFKDAEGKSRRNTTWVREPPPLGPGSKVTICYLKDLPLKSTVALPEPPDSTAQ